MAKKKKKTVVVRAPGPNADAGNVFITEPPKKRDLYETDMLPEEPDTEGQSVEF